MKRFYRPGLWVLGMLIGLIATSGCIAKSSSQMEDPFAPTLVSTITPFTTRTQSSTITETIMIPTLTETPPPLKMCAPFESYSKEELKTAVVNPFKPPLRGSDDPHQGVDLAVMDSQDRIARAGLPVKALVSGKVVGVIQDRFPYGNAVLIETPVDQLNPAQLETLSLPTPGLALETNSALTCPDIAIFSDANSGMRSLYFLYAHLQSLPELNVGDSIVCEDTVGMVGDTGNALNPHLHLEVRVGPQGLELTSMAHYDASASEYEMAAYCLWRVSGEFELIDPMLFIEQLP